jgi:uncharacterized Zn finger protein (UPF0148 family)
MMVRCGACRTQFDAPGPGRYSCPACGSVNMIRDNSGAAPASGGYPSAPGVQTERVPPPPPPERIVPKITCPECEFSFYAGDVAVVVCPNCTAEVPTGLVDAPERQASAEEE